jgi:hypothetical protein
MKFPLKSHKCSAYFGLCSFKDIRKLAPNFELKNSGISQYSNRSISSQIKLETILIFGHLDANLLEFLMQINKIKIDQEKLNSLSILKAYGNLIRWMILFIHNYRFLVLL